MFHQTNYFEPWNHNEENLFSINPHGKSWNEQRERETRPTFVNNVMYILFVYIIFSAFGVSVWPMITFYCKLLKINKLFLFIKFVLSVIIYFYNRLRFNLQKKMVRDFFFDLLSKMYLHTAFTALLQPPLKTFSRTRSVYWAVGAVARPRTLLRLIKIFNRTEIWYYS